uniref:Uncharacterized protein n=1 Tax=Amphimedon queenslandica TaxID=400682 RepID=A0A1X7TA75_AMPQE
SGIKSLTNLTTPPKVNIVSGWKRQGQAKTSTSSDLNVSGSGGGVAGGGVEGETDKEETLPDGWNGQELILFRMLRPIYCHNYCSMAEVIESKTCQEVYSYASTLPLDPILNQHPSRPPGTSQKRKNMRAWPGFNTTGRSNV